ncbi:MAG: hypothetical protein H8E26_14180 [FCB group bacterium]|nr:hypothetical protein [FCB group bacterium]
MEKLGLAAAFLIKERTAEGKDVDGDNFAKYSEDYAEKRRSENLPTHPVNLEFNAIDGMMHSIDHLVARDASKVVLYLRGSRNRRIARYHNKLGAGKSKVIRRFWGLNNDEQTKISELVQLDLKEVLGGIK